MKSKSSAFVLFLLMSVLWISNSEVVGSSLDKGSFTDTRDGQTYRWVKIGEQIWMAENLRYLPSVAGAGTGSVTNPHYYVYGYNGSNVDDARSRANYQNYGVLYNWSAVMAGESSSKTNPSKIQGICPAGWHVPSNKEWKELITYIQKEYNYHNSWRRRNTKGVGNASKSLYRTNIDMCLSFDI